MKEIFISYRRADDPKAAHLLEKCLCENFGKEAVFLDADDIELGSYFDDTLVHAIQDCKVVVAMIGKNWRGEKPNQDRFNDAADWVRKELSLGLTLNKIIIPVLLENCELEKSFSYLPEELQNLPRKNAVKLRDLEFQTDIAPLITAIASYVDFEDPLINLPLPKKDRLGYPNIPFKGLAFFTEKDARCFHGRGKEIESIFYKIENSSVIFFYGNSGVGKSSLLYAGLFPRLKNQNWEINYIRRNPSISTSEVLNSHFQKYKKFNSDQMHLVILDQIEEIFTNPTSENNPEKEASILFREILKIAQNSEWRFIVSFRSEYLAQLEDIYVKLLNGVENEIDYKQSKFYFNKFLLKPISAVGISEAILGITKNKEIKNYFSFDFENKVVPLDISKKVVFDEKANVAPWLQVILRKMWDEVEDNSERIFSKDLLDRVSNDNFEDFVTEQINNLKDNFPEAYHSGLVLDVLHFFITERVTSQSRSLEEIKKIYSKRAKIVLDLVDALKNKYLLSENMDEKTAKVLEGYRLSHDTLAPIINRLYINSTLPGQRAAAILSSKRKDFENKIAVEFSKSDLKILESGKLGMRAWTDLEEEVFQENLERVSKEEKELEEKNIELGNQLARNYLEIGKSAKDNGDNLKFLHLSAKILEISKINGLINKIFFDLQALIPPLIIGHQVSFSNQGILFNLDGSLFVTISEDYSVKLWHCKSGKQIGKSMEHRAEVLGVEFNQSGSFILSWTFDGETKLWDSTTGEQVGKSINHGGEMRKAMFNRDESLILTLGRDGSVKIWRQSTGQQIGRSLKLDSSTYDVQFNKNESHLIAWQTDKVVCIWNIKTGELVGKTNEHKESVQEVQIIENGRKIITWTKNGTISIWDTNNGKQLGKSIELEREIHGLLLNGDGSLILTWSKDCTARIWDVLTGVELGISMEHRGWIYGAKFNKEETMVLTWSDDGTARLWNRETGGQVGKDLVHNAGVTGAVFNFDETAILTWSEDGSAKIWSSFSGQQIGLSMEHKSLVNEAQFCQDECFILTDSQDKTINVWGSHSGSRIGVPIRHESLVDSVIVLGESRILTMTEKGTARILNWRKKQSPNKIMDHSERVRGARFNLNGSLVLTWSNDCTSRIWDCHTKEEVCRFVHEEAVVGALFSNDESIVLSWSLDGNARLWNSNTGKEICRAMEHEDRVNGSLFSQDESLVLTWSSDGTARIWDKESGNQVGNSMVHGGVVNGALFNSDESLILTWGKDGTVKLWDSRTSKQIGISIHNGSECLGAKFNRDESCILSWSGDNIKISANKTGKEIGIPIEMESYLLGACFNQDESLILTWSIDNTAKLWNTKTCEQVGKSMEHESGVNGAKFNRDESLILTWSDDGTVRIWDRWTGEQVIKSMNHWLEVYGAKFNKDETRVLTWSNDSTARLWDSGTGEQIGASMYHGRAVLGALFDNSEKQILSWNSDGSVKIWNIEADLDFPPEHFSLQVEVLTGTSLNETTLEVEIMKPEVWKTKKEQYEKLAREHYKVCKHPKANWWASFNPEEANKLRPEVE